MAMRVFESLEGLPEFKNAVVTLGTFDGVHLGHVEILKQINEAAREKDGESILLTFWPHPRMVLYPDDDSLRLLNTIEEKKRLLEQHGLNNLVIIPFTLEFSRMNYLEFIREVLVGSLHVKTLIVGYDHHFGKNREGSYEQLQECAPIFNFKLQQIRALKVGETAISSSKIRAALLHEDLDKANKYLGYKYQLTGTVIEGMKRGRELGYPTANISVEEKYKLIPADGIYAVEVSYEGKNYPAMASIGYNPTFGDTGKTVEVHVLNFDKDLYGKKITLHFVKFLRKEVKFANVEDLIKQIRQDEEQTLAIFKLTHENFD